MDRQLRRWLPVLLIIGALWLAGLATGGSGLTGGSIPPWQSTAPDRDPPEFTPPPFEPPAAAEDTQSTAMAVLEVAFWIPLVLVGLASLGIVLYLVYLELARLFTERVRRRGLDNRAATQPEGAADDLTEEVLGAVRAGLAEIDAGGDARRVVIACWLRLERLAAAAGSARLAADTPADLVSRLLARHRVSQEALARLAEAYRRARYAPAEIGDELVASARLALHDVDAQLGGARSGGARP
jgi:hypothetical protein